MKRKILLADDEPLMLMLISDFLSSDYEIITASDGRQAITTFKEHGDFSLAILDIMMPYLNGLEVLSEIKKDSNIPIILLTAKNTETDELMGLISGADEYIKKPFSPSILKARVDIIIKRIYPAINPQINTCGDLSIDLKKGLITCCGKELDLSLTEYNLLKYMIENEGITLSRDSLLDSVWGLDYEGTDRTVDTTINRLRIKLAPSCDYIKTIRGLGYRFEVKK